MDSYNFTTLNKEDNSHSSGTCFFFFFFFHILVYSAT